MQKRDLTILIVLILAVILALSQTKLTGNVIYEEAWIKPDSASTYLGSACNAENILRTDESFAGLARISSDAATYIDDIGVSSCIKVDFKQTYNANEVQIKLKSIDSICGDSCWAEYCGTGTSVYLFSSETGAGNSWSYVGEISMTSILNWQSHISDFSARYLLICRRASGHKRDNVAIDVVKIKTILTSEEIEEQEEAEEEAKEDTTQGIQECPPGDMNGDGKVDGADLAIWQQDYTTSGDYCGRADLNNDGNVDSEDKEIWDENYDPLGIGECELPELSCIEMPNLHEVLPEETDDQVDETEEPTEEPLEETSEETEESEETNEETEEEIEEQEQQEGTQIKETEIKEMPKFIALADIRQPANLNIEPKEVVARLKDLGVDIISYPCTYMGPITDKKGNPYELGIKYADYTESFFYYLDETKELDAYVIISSDCLNRPDGRIYSYDNIEEFQSLLDRHSSIKGIIYDDYIGEYTEFEEYIEDIDFNGKRYGVIYSNHPGQIDGMSLAPKLDGYIDYIGGKLWDDYDIGERYEEKNYAEGIMKIRAEMPDVEVLSGFYCYTRDYIYTPKSQFKRFLAEAKLENADGYSFYMPDWGSGYKKWNSVEFDDEFNEQKYATIKAFIQDFKGIEPVSWVDALVNYFKNLFS